MWDLSQKPGQMKTGLCEGVKWGDVSQTLGVPQALGWFTGYKSPGGVVVRLSIAVLKHQDQKQLGEERLYFVLQLTFFHMGKSVQEL